MIKDRPKAGELQHLEPGLSCVLAPNPSPMTYWGTNTYLLGRETLAVIDPGPQDDVHLAALVRAIDGRNVSHIIVTHSHSDHSPLARSLANATGAPVCAFGDSSAGRSAIMRELGGNVGGGEGVDTDFAPDLTLRHGQRIETEDWGMEVLHTPGHFCNHISLIWGNAAFTGDHLMGWASSLVSPPDGDLTDFMASCDALMASGITRAYSAHGAPIQDAQSRLADLVAHRHLREAQIIKALQDAPATSQEIANAIYIDTPDALMGMAARNVLAHLIDLTQRGLAAPIGRLDAGATFKIEGTEKTPSTP